MALWRPIVTALPSHDGFLLMARSMNLPCTQRSSGDSQPRSWPIGDVPTRVSKDFLLATPVLMDAWENDPGNPPLSAYLSRDLWDLALIDHADPRLLAPKALSAKYNIDSPNYKQAMASPFQAEWWRAMAIEMETLLSRDAWEYVPCTPNMKVIPSTWAFLLKRRPDLEPKKFKARFCARGNCQVEGVDVFERWAPVAQWSTVMTVMILAAKLGLVYAQCDTTAAFLHAKLPPDKVQQPAGFVRNRGHVLRLNCCLYVYGIRQTPKHFFDEEFIIVTYFDDIVIYDKTNKSIDGRIKRLQKEEILLHHEGTAEGYLGVQIERDGGCTRLTQPGMTKKGIEALGICSKHSTPVATPTEKAPLPRVVNGESYDGPISYASIVGMMLYLTRHSRPDCAFAVNKCACYNFEPKRPHVSALNLKRTGRYLKGTADKCLILDPSPGLGIDCYPDADFAGLYGYEEPQDPHCTRSRTGYVIILDDCPMLWRFSLQSEIALSTLEAEYVALSTAMKDLLPLVDLVKEITGCWNLP
ncbi:LOW QUALITY PROTEIN: hypothetical protein ACHAWF_001417, partial [Thalassiosira exigua]